MVTKKTESCSCVDSKCDPCECKENTGCGKSRACNSSWCTGGAILRITIAVLLIVGAFGLGIKIGTGHDRDSDRYGGMSHDRDGRGDDRGGEHTPPMNCPMMQGGKMDSMMDMSGSHDMMSMSMSDMGKMLEGKTGDDLNRAFLEGMIPHHQAAVDMAHSLAASNKPELVRLGADIIAAQTKEIEQMKQWMVEWGYAK